MKDNQQPSAYRLAIEAIAADNRAGAAEIVRQAAAVFALLHVPDHADVAQARALIASVCGELVRAQPKMAPIINMARAVTTAASPAADPADAIRLAIQAADAFSRRSVAAAAATAKHTANLIHPGSTILTHSRSSTVLSALSIAAGSDITFNVIVTESRPVLEGRTLATEIATQGISVTLIADVAAALAMREKIDFVLVGADKVTPEHVVNKIGTLMISLAARENAIPVHAACDTSKFIAVMGPVAAEHERQNPAELWRDPPQNVNVKNEYFEETPLRYFSSVITEDGMLSPSQAAERAARNTLS